MTKLVRLPAPDSSKVPENSSIYTGQQPTAANAHCSYQQSLSPLQRAPSGSWPLNPLFHNQEDSNEHRRLVFKPASQPHNNGGSGGFRDAALPQSATCRHPITTSENTHTNDQSRLPLDQLRERLQTLRSGSRQPSITSEPSLHSNRPITNMIMQANTGVKGSNCGSVTTISPPTATRNFSPASQNIQVSCPTGLANVRAS